MLVFPRSFALAALASVLIARPSLAQDTDGWRTIEIETTEVTTPDVAITPDGETLIFTLLGHLFRLAVEGGEAEQLTFGPYYDAKPAVSPDGTQVAFQSDRDGSEGNIFLMDLATREITQLTDESWADAPSWSPDGRSVVYLQLVREAWNASDAGPNANPRRPPPPAVVRRIRLDGGERETLRADVSEVRSPFHLRDGRVGWAIVERDMASPHATTRIEVMGPDGAVATARTFDGVVDAIIVSGDDLLARRFHPVRMRSENAQQREVVQAPLFGQGERPILPVSDVWLRYISGEPRFARSPTTPMLFVGNLGRLWRVSPDEGEQEAIPFRARVRMQVLDPVPPREWTIPEPEASGRPRGFRAPRLSPDGRSLAFRAAGHVWVQPLGGGPVRRVSDVSSGGIGLTFSPDGNRLAFFTFRSPGSELRVFDLTSGELETVGTFSDRFEPSWTPDGRGLIAWEETDGGRARLTVARMGEGTTDSLIELAAPADPHTTVSVDGQWLFFLQRSTIARGEFAVFRLRLGDPSTPPELLTRLAFEFALGRVSSDGLWFVYVPPNRPEIRAVALGTSQVSAADSRLVSSMGGEAAQAFGLDGSSVVYTGPGSRVWRRPIEGGEAEEIPVRLEFRRPRPRPLLIRRVRVLDFETGDFSVATSMLVVDGRIAWTGSEAGRSLPTDLSVVDAEGRLAIPGLFDMHGHRGDCSRSAFLQFGVTSVRNIGGRAELASRDADRSTYTAEPVPRCFYSGNVLEGEQGRNNDQFFIHLENEADARAQVRQMQGWGASFIKLYDVLPWPLHRAAADEARQLGLPVITHGIRAEEVSKAVTLGYRLTHTPGLVYEDVLRLLAAVGMRADPTVGSVPGGEILFRRSPERFLGPRDVFPVGDDALYGLWAKRLRSVRRAYELGITLLPGTDGWGPHGWTLHAELEFFAEAGIPAIDVLRFATLASAETVGAGDELGTLESGKLADILLLDANPLDDIRNTQAIWRVIKGGFVFDPEETPFSRFPRLRS